MGSGFSKQKKQMRALREQMGKMQTDMQNTEVTGSAGNGLVTITLSGDNKMKCLIIKPECVDPEDVEALQDLIKAAYQNALDQLNNAADSQMPSLPNFPGFPGIPGMPGI